MSGYTSAPWVFRSTDRGGSVRAWARALRARWTFMRRAAETRRELGRLDPRLLADIGLSRAEAEREAERWPWDTGPGHRPGGWPGARRP